MSNLQVLKATFDVARRLYPTRASGDESEDKLRADREGNLITKPWLQALAEEGRLYIANVGSLTTPVAGKALDLDQPELVVRLPTGSDVAVIPVDIEIHMEDTVSTANDMLIAWSTIDIGNGTSTEVVPRSLKGGRLGAQALARRTYTGNGSLPVVGTDFFELKHRGALYDAATEAFGPAMSCTWRLMDGGYAPTLTPPASIACYYGGAGASTGFITAVWAEIPLSLVT